MFKKIAVFISLLIFIFLSFSAAFAQDDTIKIYFFSATGCPHCKEERPFLEKMKEKYPQLEIVELEVTENKDNLKLLTDVGKKLDANVSGVPFTVIGEKYISGYMDENTSGAKIEEAINCAINTKCEDIVGNIKNSSSQNNLSSSFKIPEKIKVPIFGEINIKNLSLPVITIILGTLDGFNPCAMWTLIFLITLLLGMEDKRKMWILGTVFILASGLVYFMFMAAWLNLILFLGFIVWIRIIIGLVALYAGYYNLKEYKEDLKNNTATCKVTQDKKQQKIFEKLKKITQNRNFWMALGGIVLLAFAVNLVEAICSAGLPAIFTQLLAINDLPKLQYYGYILLYLFFFMLDDMIVFGIAMVTLQMTGVTSKYTKFSHLIGGILMLVIGLLLILKPEWLMLG